MKPHDFIWIHCINGLVVLLMIFVIAGIWYVLDKFR